MAGSRGAATREGGDLGRLGVALVLSFAALLPGCGGGSDDGGESGSPNPIAPLFLVGGTLTGLSGSLVLQNNLGDNLTLSSNGSFAFATAVANAATYSVSVLTQPAGQTCTVANATGTVNGANITVVAVSCTSAFAVTINLTSGIISFPNKYSGWTVGGGAATNFVAFPSGWSVGGGAATNFIALPPGWTVGGGAATNFVAVPPGWSVGGGAATNFVAVPPGWSVGGGSATNFVALPPGFTAGGGSATNFVALPPGWTAGGGSATNFFARPPGWSVGGGSATNFVGLAPGWTTGGGSATNFVALPPGWSTGGGAATNFIAVPPGWAVGGGAATNFVTYPGPTVTTMQIAFNDPGFLALFQNLQASGNYSDSALADIITAVFLNAQPFHLQRTGPYRGTSPRELAPAGQW